MTIRLLRPTVVGLACDVGVPECLTEVVAVFKNWIANTSRVQKPHPDLRSIVYSYGKYEVCNSSPAFLFWLCDLAPELILTIQSRVSLQPGVTNAEINFLKHLLNGERNFFLFCFRYSFLLEAELIPGPSAAGRIIYYYCIV
jgi:hypothetical protein